jgi:hypothetical protein
MDKDFQLIFRFGDIIALQNFSIKSSSPLKCPFADIFYYNSFSIPFLKGQ